MGIPLGGGNFTRGAAIPIDESSVVADITARNLIGSGIRYKGFKVYSVADKKTYVLKNDITNADWEEDSPTVATPATYCDKFTATAAQVAFTLTADPVLKDNTLVFKNSVYQEKSTYTLVTTTLTLDEGCEVGDKIQVTYGIVAIGNLTDNIVTTTKIADLAVTQAKLALKGASLTTAVPLGGIYKSATITYANATGSFTDAAVSAALTLGGRPVRIEFQPDGNLANNASLIEILSTGYQPGAVFKLLRGLSGVYTSIAEFSLGALEFANGGSGSTITYSPAALNHTDTDYTPGVYTYKLQAARAIGGVTVTMYRFKMVIYEI